MQLITNENFVNSRVKIGRLGTLLGLVAMGGGFVLSLNVETMASSQYYVIATYFVLILGLLAFNVGRYNSIRWGVRPRVDEILTNALKGLDQKYVLLNYVPGMPSSHILLSPFGLFHIETRHNDGEIICEGESWRRKRSWLLWMRGFSEGQLGNPCRSAQMAAARLTAFLGQTLGEEVASQVPVEGVVVFVSPRVDLKVNEPTVPVVTPKDLKALVRSPQGRSKILPDVYRRLQETLANGHADGRLERTTKSK